MTETTIEPKDVQVGDRVMRPATVVRMMDDLVIVKYDNNPCEVALSPIQLIEATITRPIDPDVLLVRRELAKVWPDFANIIESGDWDHGEHHRAALAAVKAVRAEVGK